MKMPRDLVMFRRRIVVVSAVLISLCTAACMMLLAAPLIDADMAARRHMLEEISNQPFDIERVDADIGADRTSGLVVTGPDVSWCRVAVDESAKMVAVERGGAVDVDSLSESAATQLVCLRDGVGNRPFSFDGRKWIGLWQPLDAQDGAVTVLDGNVAAVEAAPTGKRLYTFLDVTPHGEYVSSIVFRCMQRPRCRKSRYHRRAQYDECSGRDAVMDAREREWGFVTSASHELKTPLMAITSACDVLEAEAGIPADVPGDSSIRDDSGYAGSFSRWVSVIREASDEMAQSISDMLRSLDGGV